jgi:hypothetical protein
MQCQAGKYSTTLGAISVDTCLNCVAGKYSVTKGNGAEIYCTNWLALNLQRHA